MRILVVEDEINYITIYRRLLEQIGHQVIVATCGSDALDVVENHPEISLVLLDLHLPDFDGIDLCRLIKSSSRDKTMYVILVTGDNSSEVHSEGLDAGADDFLTKPVDLGILASRIKVGVRSVEMTQELRDQRKRAETLFRENELFTQGFNESKQPHVFTDQNGIITHVNRAAEEFYGYPRGHLIGIKTSVFNAGRTVYGEKGMADTEYDDHFRGLWDTILDANAGHWDGYVYNRTVSGQVKEIHLRINSLRGSKGELLGFGAIHLDVTDILERERQIRYACYQSIVDLAEVRDNETGEHLHRMSEYSALLAERMGLSRRFIIDIRRFAPFHDIGKVGVPDSILLAPRKLTPEEFEIIQTHPVIGFDILKNAETLQFAADIAHTHHEKYNGKGYPQGTKGEDIPLCGRIIALADVYDALRTKRPYKEPWEHAKVLELISAERGEHFDPKIVDVFLQCHEEFKMISERYYA